MKFGFSTGASDLRVYTKMTTDFINQRISGWSSHDSVIEVAQINNVYTKNKPESTVTV